MSAESATTALRMSEAEFLDHYADLRPSYEYVNGEVTQKPMTKQWHLLIADELAGALRDYRRSGAGGISGEEPTVNLSKGRDRRYRVPDVAYWAPGRQPSSAQVFVPPTLAIEIQSPGQTVASLTAKCREYRERGVDAVWLILPSARAALVFEGEADSVRLAAPAALTSGYLPGFELPLADLFATLDRE